MKSIFNLSLTKDGMPEPQASRYSPPPVSPERPMHRVSSGLLNSEERAIKRRDANSPHNALRNILSANKVGVFLDTNSMYIPGLQKGKLTNIQFLTNRGVEQEYTRIGNYKGGAHLVINANLPSYDIGSVGVFPSKIDISDLLTDTLSKQNFSAWRLLNKGNGKTYCPGDPNISSMQNIISAIAFFRVYGNYSSASGILSHNQEKAHVIQDFFSGLTGPLHGKIDELLSKPTEITEEDIKEIHQLLQSAFKEKNSTMLRQSNILIDKLYELDSQIFYRKNKDIIDMQSSVDPAGPTVLYYIYRMMSRALALQDEGVSADHIDVLRETKHLQTMPKSVFTAFDSFLDFLWDKNTADTLSDSSASTPSSPSSASTPKLSPTKKKREQGERKRIFKGKFITLLDDLFLEYNRYSSRYADYGHLSEIEHQKINDFFSSEEGYTLEKLIEGTRAYLENHKQYGQLIDDSFDVNDFALCLDAIEHGAPILTNNAAMQNQVWSNLARAIIIGRDVQFIIIRDLVKAANKADISAVVAEDILQYCNQFKDTRHLWRVQAYESFSKLSTMPCLTFSMGAKACLPATDHDDAASLLEPAPLAPHMLSCPSAFAFAVDDEASSSEPAPLAPHMISCSSAFTSVTSDDGVAEDDVGYDRKAAGMTR